jgi:hypothetical protein
MVENFSWTNPKDDARIYIAIRKVTAAIERELLVAGQSAKYKYLNDTGEGQPIFENYRSGILARLKAIRAKYDPHRIYTDLLLGGLKVDKA